MVEAVPPLAGNDQAEHILCAMSELERYWIEVAPDPVLAAVRAWQLATNSPATVASIRTVLSPETELEAIEERDLIALLEELVRAGEIRATPEGYEAIGL